MAKKHGKGKKKGDNQGRHLTIVPPAPGETRVVPGFGPPPIYQTGVHDNLPELEEVALDSAHLEEDHPPVLPPKVVDDPDIDREVAEAQHEVRTNLDLLMQTRREKMAEVNFFGPGASSGQEVTIKDEPHASLLKVSWLRQWLFGLHWPKWQWSSMDIAIKKGDPKPVEEPTKNEPYAPIPQESRLRQRLQGLHWPKWQWSSRDIPAVNITDTDFFRSLRLSERKERMKQWRWGIGLAALAGVFVIPSLVFILTAYAADLNADFDRFDRESTAEVKQAFTEFTRELDEIPPPDPEQDWEAAKQFFRGLAP